MSSPIVSHDHRPNLVSRLSIEHLWILAVLVGVFFFVNTHPIRPHDFWWHIAAGRQILATGQIPTVDTYSYTMAGRPYLSYRSFWLMEVFLYLIYSWGGPALVVFAQSLLVTSAYAVLLWVSRGISGSGRAAALGVLLAAALGFNDWNVRPQAVTFLIGALFLAAIHAYRNSRGPVWLAVFPPGMLVWVNSHGSFPLGLALLGLWLGDEVWQAWRAGSAQGKTRSWKGLPAPAFALAAASLACLVNPSGFGILGYLRAMADDPVVQNLVPEWAPPSFATLHGALFLVGLLLAAALLALSPRRPDFFELASFLVFAALGLKTARGALWFGLVMAPLVARHLAALTTSDNRSVRRSRGSARVNAAFLVALTIMAALSLPWFKEALPWPGVKAGLISIETPVAATRFLLDQRLPRQVFHAMPFGSYLAWAAQPGYPVFVDSRIELYTQGVWLDYLQISNAFPGWEQRLEDYGVNTLMLGPSEQAPLIAAARASPDWEQVYRDEAAIIFVRRK